MSGGQVLRFTCRGGVVVELELPSPVGDEPVGVGANGLAACPIGDGWMPLGGASYGEHEAFSDKVWAQSMIKCDCEEE